MAEKLKEAAESAFKKMPKGGPGGGLPGGPGGKLPLALIKGGAALAGAGYLAANSVYSVDAGHRAVVFNRFSGVKPFVYSEGLNFNIPWAEWPTVFDIKTRPCNLQTQTGSKDLQKIMIGIRVLHRPIPSELPFILCNLGENYDEKVLPSIMNECAKAVVAQFNASELLTKREEVSREIRRALEMRASKFKIVLEDVAITHYEFSSEFKRAVEAKQVAKQEAERAKYIVQRAYDEKKTVIAYWEGEAESTKKIGDAVKKNPGYVNLKRIEAATDIADIVSRSGNKVFLNADSLLLNLVGNVDEKLENGVTGRSKNSWF